MNDIDIYNNSSVIMLKKVPVKIISWITILLVFLIFILVFGILFTYNKYEKCIGIVRGNNIVLELSPDKINKIKDGLYIDNKKYDFEIKEISNDYIIIDNKNYYEIVLNINLEDKYKIDNNILEIYIELEKTTLLKEIFNFLKKGLM